jgi:hypothetical protein
MKIPTLSRAECLRTPEEQPLQRYKKERFLGHCTMACLLLTFLSVFTGQGWTVVTSFIGNFSEKIGCPFPPSIVHLPSNLGSNVVHLHSSLFDAGKSVLCICHPRLNRQTHLHPKYQVQWLEGLVSEQHMEGLSISDVKR